MNLFLGMLAIVPAAIVRLLIFVAGWFLIPFFMDNKSWIWTRLYGDSDDIAPAAMKNRWTAYWEMAFRNPTNGLKYWLNQPIPEVKPNPDQRVRGYLDHEGFYNEYKYDDRWMIHGLFWEYWYLRQIDWTIPSWIPLIGGRHYKWFEFRIGWKFVDGNEEFFPTLQFGPRSS